MLAAHLRPRLKTCEPELVVITSLVPLWDVTAEKKPQDGRETALLGVFVKEASSPATLTSVKR